jgi:adenine-specific DNA-methyltransferase
VRQALVCCIDNTKFAKWPQGLENTPQSTSKRAIEKILKIEIDDKTFGRVYEHVSNTIYVKNDQQKIAVRVISQFGDESTKVIAITSVNTIESLQ